jgi:hypothetical protein
MKLVSEYLQDAINFERLAAEAEEGPFKQSLLQQAAAYRKLAAQRAEALGVPLPPDPKPEQDEDRNELSGRFELAGRKDGEGR